MLLGGMGGSFPFFLYLFFCCFRLFLFYKITSSIYSANIAIK